MPLNFKLSFVKSVNDSVTKIGALAKDLVSVSSNHMGCSQLSDSSSDLTLAFCLLNATHTHTHTPHSMHIKNTK